MPVLQALREALREILRSPFRSLLTLQGVIWGTALGILPPALLRGSRELSIQKAEALGTNRILIVESGASGKGLRWEKAALLEQEFRGEVEACAAIGLREGSKVATLVVGHGAERLRRHQLAEGRWLLAPGEVVLEAKLARDLQAAGALPARCLGRSIDLGDGLPPATIVGVTIEQASPSLDQDVFGYEKGHWLHGLVEEVKRTFGLLDPELQWLEEGAHAITLGSRYPDALASVIEVRADPLRVADLARRLRERLVLSGVDPILYHNPVSQILFSEQLGLLEKVHWVIFIACILVGTVVVACVRVLTVLERRAEVAIRRVEGATVWQIVLQFSLETAAFVLCGTILGVPLGLALAWLRASLDPSGAITWVLPGVETSITIVSVLVMGTVGGLLPAVRAARVKPAEILGRD